MKEHITPVADAIKNFEGVTWTSWGDPLLDEDDKDYMPAGWVKFTVQKSEQGWRTLEFLAWLVTDMERGGEQIQLFPTAPPPYLNTPGACLSFVLEIYPDADDAPLRFSRVGKFIDDCREAYWAECVEDL